MDLGLGNLNELKRRLLPATMQSQTTYDTAIASTGRGVAGLFDSYCNRKFARLAGAQDQFTADRRVWTTQRYPVEVVTGLEMRDTLQTDWRTLVVNELIINYDLSAGLIQFGAMLGIYLTHLRLTYTGGYWYDTSEDGSGVMPVGATALPGDVKEAWFLQAAEVWDKRDQIGLSLITKPEEWTTVSKIDLAQIVRQMIDGYRRMQIT